jgi:hypothetical protein
MIVLGVLTMKEHGRGLMAHILNQLINPMLDLVLGLAELYL